MDKQEKKSIFKRWWFWVIVVIVIIAIAASVGGDDGNTSTPNGADNTVDGNSGVPPAQTDTTEQEEQETEAPETISFTKQLSSGNYIAGIDFPAGTYDIEAVKGNGNVSSSNAFSGGINAVMGTEEANKALGSDLYEQKYSNIELPEGTILYISGVTVTISSDNASGKPLKAREQLNTETVTLENGNFISGKDFAAGVYDITAVSGSGNVSSDNLASGGINAIMGTEDANKALGQDLYEQSYKNIELPEGTTLTISGVKIRLTPSK